MPLRMPDSQYRKFRNILLTRDELSLLLRRREYIVIRDIFLCWLLILSSWVCVAIYPSPVSILVAVAVIGNRYYALSIIGHDGLHGNLFSNKSLNNWINDIFVLAPVGTVTKINKIHHLLHHKWLSTEKDPDREKYACFNKTDILELLIYLIGISGLRTTIRNVFSKSSLNDKNSTHLNHRDFFLIMTVQAILILGLTIGIGYWAYPVLWTLPVVVFGYLAGNLRGFAEHSQPHNDQISDHNRLITHLPNKLERILISPMNMNFHTAHHLWPTIPYYNLPVADKIIRPRATNAAELEWRKSYIGYLWRYFLRLPIDECKKQIA